MNTQRPGLVKRLSMLRFLDRTFPLARRGAPTPTPAHPHEGAHDATPPWEGIDAVTWSELPTAAAWENGTGLSLPIAIATAAAGAGPHRALPRIVHLTPIDGAEVVALCGPSAEVGRVVRGLRSACGTRADCSVSIVPARSSPSAEPADSTGLTVVIVQDPGDIDTPAWRRRCSGILVLGPTEDDAECAPLGLRAEQLRRSRERGNVDTSAGGEGDWEPTADRRAPLTGWWRQHGAVYGVLVTLPDS